MIRIPLSQIGSAGAFAKAVLAHKAALEKQMLGKAGIPMPVAHPLVESVIVRVPQDGPVADRGPDEIEIAPYEVYDDRPVSPAVQKTINTLRETINQGA